MKETFQSRASSPSNKEKLIQVLKKMEQEQDPLFNLEDDAELSNMRSIKQLPLDDRKEIAENIQRNGEEYNSSEDDDISSEYFFPASVIKALYSFSDVDEAVDYLSNLPLELTQKFIAAIRDGKLSHLCSIWIPWWLQPSKMDELLNRRPGGYIEQLNEEENENDSNEISEHGSKTKKTIYRGEIPKIGKIIPFKNLYRSSQPPSPTLVFDFLDILFSYVLMMRGVNGDWSYQPYLCVEDILQYVAFYSNSVLLSIFLFYIIDFLAKIAFLSFSSILGLNNVHSSVESVFFHKTSLPSISLSQLYVAIQDCQSILKVKRFVVSAIYDIRNVFLEACRENIKLKSTEVENIIEIDRDILKKIKFCVKKLTFFISWVWEQDCCVFERLGVQVTIQQGILKEKQEAKSRHKSKKQIIVPIISFSK